jgi:hypothetical protein
MLNTVVYLLQLSIWVAFIGGVFGLFIMRLFECYLAKLDLKHSLKVLFIPFSVGYYLQFRNKTRFKKVYEFLVVTFSLFSMIGFLFIIYTRYL